MVYKLLDVTSLKRNSYMTIEIEVVDEEVENEGNEKSKK